MDIFMQHDVQELSRVVRNKILFFFKTWKDVPLDFYFILHFQLLDNIENKMKGTVVEVRVIFKIKWKAVYLSCLPKLST